MDRMTGSSSLNPVIQILALLLFLSISIIPVARSAVLSIDVGSEWMKVAVVNLKPGQIPISIAINEMSKRKSPVLVGFSGGERLVGEEAAGIVARYPEKVFSIVRDMIGKSYGFVKNAIGSMYLPFDLVEDERGAVNIRIEDGVYTVEELMAMVLQYAMGLSKDHVKVLVRDAVITVPAYFGQAERKGMMQAAQLAGINVLALINEHSGAALQYGIDKDFGNESRHVMFYDIGAGSTYAALVYFSAYKVKEYGKTVSVNQFQVKDVRWNTEIGSSSSPLAKRAAAFFPAIILKEEVISISYCIPQNLHKEQKQKMSGKGSHAIEKKNGVFFGIFESELPKWDPQAVSFRSCGGVFASIGQVGVGFDVPSSSSTPNSRDNGLKIPCNDIALKSIPSEVGVRIVDILPKTGEDELLENLAVKKNEGFKLKFKVSNPSLRRLISGAFAGAVSRTAVAPLETIRTHLMVGNSGHSTGEVFSTIMKTDGWKGLFRGNFVNVIRVAPSKAIELFAYDTVKKMLTPKPEEPLKIPVPPSLVAGACAGISSTLCTYPLELLKTRITIQKGVYNNLLDAFVKIVRDEGPGELYRGLTPSLIGVVPYAATNYFAYDALRKAYKKTFKKDPGNLATLFIGSMAGAISSSTTFPLEVARKQMQVGALGGRRVYNNMLHALICILEKEGVEGLYKGLGPSCMKLVPAAGIAFMCYEGCKKVLVEDEEPERKGMN